MLEGVLGLARDRPVTLDCSALAVSTPSFTDELILILLIEARARHLTLLGAPSRTAEFALRSAELRGVADKLTIE